MHLPWDQLLDLLSTLVEKYEDEHYPIEPSPPHRILRHLMEARDLSCGVQRKLQKAQCDSKRKTRKTREMLALE